MTLNQNFQRRFLITMILSPHRLSNPGCRNGLNRSRMRFFFAGLLLPICFYGDYYGIERDQIAPVPLLKEMVWIRKNLLGDGIVDFNDDDPKKPAGWFVQITP